MGTYDIYTYCFSSCNSNHESVTVFLVVMCGVVEFLFYFIVYLFNHVIPPHQFLWFLESIYSFHFLVFI